LKSNKFSIKLFNNKFADYILFLEAATYTMWAFLMIRIFSFKRYIHWIKNPSKNKDNNQESLRVLYTINRVKKYSFWPTTCYTEAIAARIILKRKGIRSQIYFGVRKDEHKKLHAHAWTKVNEKIITGQGNLDLFKVIYIFDD